jgi:hypothetical protein
MARAGAVKEELPSRMPSMTAPGWSGRGLVWGTQEEQVRPQGSGVGERGAEASGRPALCCWLQCLSSHGTL